MYLTRLPSGRWRVAVKYKGRRETATADTKQAARVVGAQLLVNLGAKQTPDTVPVGDLIAGHLQRVDWSPTTKYDAELVANALPDAFKNRHVSDIDGAVLAALYRQLAGLGWSAHRIRRAHFVISTAWSEAITSKATGRRYVRHAVIAEFGEDGGEQFGVTVGRWVIRRFGRREGFRPVQRDAEGV